MCIRDSHRIVDEMNVEPYLFKRGGKKMKFVYAGAMLPKAYQPLESIFKAIHQHRGDFKDIEFHFIGSGKSPNDANGYNIKNLAKKYHLWEEVVFEYPKRIPY